MEVEGRPKEGRLRRWFGKLKFWGRGKGIDRGTEKLLRLAYEKVNEHYSTYKLVGGDPGFEPKHPTFEDVLKDEEVVDLAKKSKFWERAGLGLTAAGGAGMLAGITSASSASLLSFLALGFTPLGLGLLAGLGAYKLSNKYWKQLKEKMKKKPERKTRIVMDEKVEEYLELAHKKIMKEYAEQKALAEKEGISLEFEPRHRSLEEVKRDLTAIELAEKVKKWDRRGIASLLTGGAGSIASTLGMAFSAATPSLAVFLSGLLGPIGLGILGTALAARKSNTYFRALKNYLVKRKELQSAASERISTTK